MFIYTYIIHLLSVSDLYGVSDNSVTYEMILMIRGNMSNIAKRLIVVSVNTANTGG